MMRRIAASIAVALGMCMTVHSANAAPDFSGFWQHGVPGQQYDRPPSGPGPVRRVSSFPDNYAPNINWHGDDTNPILQPWAAEAVRKEWERESQGLPELSPQTVCKPAGVPMALSLLRPMQFLQDTKKVWILYQFDHQSRTIYMDVPHSKDVKPSYYGESVGHYDGDTLIVDTIGFNDKTWTDRFATPHTEKLHVVERYRVVNGGKTLEVNFTVDDPGAFTTPWAAITRYQRMPEVEAITEEACAENNSGYGLSTPVAATDPISGAKLP